MTFKIITDPKTGKAETQSGLDSTQIQKSLEETKRELKDMIAGNTKFHTDPNTPEPDKEGDDEVNKDAWTSTGYWGFFTDT